MRGDDLQQAGMFNYLSPEQRVPAEHPLRAIRKIADAVFVQLSPQFDQMYARMGRPSNSAGEVVAGLAAAGALQRAQRAVADGRVGLQHALSLVRRAEHG
jgi:hypothetical protein